jgi:hypothetical protein
MSKQVTASICIVLSLFTAYVGLKAVITRHVAMGSSGRGSAGLPLNGPDAVSYGAKWLIATAILLIGAFLIWRYGKDSSEY